MTRKERTQIEILQKDVAELRLDMRWMKRVMGWGIVLSGGNSKRGSLPPGLPHADPGLPSRVIFFLAYSIAVNSDPESICFRFRYLCLSLKKKCVLGPIRMAD